MENEDLDSNETTNEEIGSDELLSDDNLRLPDSANVLVRLHAVRAWLERRQREAAIEAGMAALAFQQATSGPVEEKRPRRRLHQQADTAAHAERAQQQLSDARQRMEAFEEAQTLLEECIAHTNGARALVEYYLTIEQRMVDDGYSLSDSDNSPVQHTPWFDAMAEVLQRIEQVGTPQED